MNTVLRQRSETVYSLKNFTILLAEDYDFMQGLLSTMLRAFGVGNIMVCGSGNEAIELLQITQAQGKNNNIKPIDLVLVDWMMMEGTGLELIDWVRNHKSDAVRFMPLVLLSSFTSEDVVIAARDHGANESLVKPLSGEKLAARILSVIDHPRAFVKSASFFGPDRRRRDKTVSLERRKTNPDEVITHTEQL